MRISDWSSDVCSSDLGALSADGKWLAYQLTPDEGSPQREATVILRSTKGKVERRYVAGDPERGAGLLRMSVYGRWIAFIRVPAASAKADGAASVEVLGKGVCNLAKIVGICKAPCRDGA